MRYDFLDAVRGFAILTITFNHVGDMVARLGFPHLRIPTLTQTDFSSAAELFVIVSGFLFGAVYAANKQPGFDRAFARRCLRRVIQLYAANIGLFLALLLIVALAPPAIGDATGFTLVWETKQPVVDLLPRFLTLSYAPFVTDVFVLYIYLIALTFALESLPVPDWVKLAISIGLFVGFYALSQRRMQNVVYLGFNPLTWQILFVVPAIIGRRLRNDDALARLFPPRHATTFLLVGLALIVLSVLISLGDHAELYSLSRVRHAYFQKFGLGVGRLTHAVLVFATLSLLFWWLKPRLPRLVAVFATVGAVSMPAFLAGALAAYSLGTLWYLAGGGFAVYVAALATALATVIAFAFAWHAFRRSRRQAPA